MAEASLYAKGFIILRSEGGLTSFNINNRVNFSGEQKQNETLSFFVVVFWFFLFFLRIWGKYSKIFLEVVFVRPDPN